MQHFACTSRCSGLARSGAAVALLALLATGGCHFAPPANSKNLQKGIERYLAEHPDCLYKQALRFPYETSSKPEIAQLDTLVNAKLLERGTEPGNSHQSLFRFDLRHEVGATLLLRLSPGDRDREFYRAGKGNRRLQRVAGDLPLHGARRSGVGEGRGRATDVS